MTNVIELAHRRHTPTFMKSFSHPAGVEFYFEEQSDADLIIPEIRSAVCDGTYGSNLIRRLPDVVRTGDRVLVIGAGLGIISTLVAKTKGVSRVIAIEPNITLIPHLNRVHARNGVPWVETINAVLRAGSKGRVGFFARRDSRASSPVPHDSPWERTMMVPSMDLGLILTDERISLVICEAPIASKQLLKCVEHGSVERILISNGDSVLEHRRDANATHLVANLNHKPVDSRFSTKI